MAFLLGLLFPGLGHVYAGRPWRGIGAFAIRFLLILPLASLVLAAYLGSPMQMMQGYAIWLGLFLLVPLDGAMTAWKRSGEPLTRWNRLWVYAAYGVVSSLIVFAGQKPFVSHYPVQMSMIPSGGMEPTLQIGDYVLTDAFHDGSSALQPGGIIVFEYPADPRVRYAKRLAGLPGQTIEVRRGTLIVDGQSVAKASADHAASQEEESLGAHRYAIEPCPSCSWGPATVPEGSVFILGDNRGRSADSRVYGFVPIPAIRGRVLGIAWSQAPNREDVRWERLGKRL